MQPVGHLRETFRSFGPAERFLVLLPAVVAGGYAAASVPDTEPSVVVPRVGMVFVVVSLVALSLAAAVALVRPVSAD
jgi:hypothetical protein